MVRHRAYRILLVLSTWVLIQTLAAQTGKDNIFGDVEKMLLEAKEQGAELLAPTFYTKATESFQEANELYLKNKSTRDIKSRLDEAQKNCNRSLEVVKLAKITLKEVIQAREDALSAEANTYAEEIFMKGEKEFFAATREVEKDDLEDARDVGSKAEEYYRSAELKAIKDKLLNEARQLIGEATNARVEKYAPQSFSRARDLLNEVEDLLTYNRYAKEEAQAKVDECVYQARHAIFLADEIQGLQQDNTNWEKLILRYEDILTGLVAPFEERTRYDNGMQPTIDLILARIKNMQAENQQMRGENVRMQEDYKVLKEKESISSAELAKKQEREAKFNKVKSIFTPQEARVFYDGDNLVIRLYGLIFPSGKAVIQPEYFSLLSKVMEALKVFPNKLIMLEGHTDSKGVPLANKTLSEERAAAVREYIVANMGKSRDEITAMGYGSARPVAPNETEEGRALNRRIDIVINLGE